MLAKNNNDKRYGNVDALRGVAAILVMILHTYNAFIGVDEIKVATNMPENLFSYFDIGRIGITIFFLISGFVIGRSIMGYESHSIKTFFTHRFFRLFPLFWFSILLAIALIKLTSDNPVDISILLANVTMLPAWFNKPFLIGLYWSLETELIFYFFVFILFSITGLKKVKYNIVITLMLFAISAVFVFFPQVSPAKAHWMATPYHLGLMFLGLTWREFYELEGTHKIKQLFRLHLGLLLSVPVFFISLFIFMRTDLNLSDSIAYLLGILVFGLGVKYWRKPHSIALFFGKISYSIYLLHPVVFQVFLHLYIRGKFNPTNHLFFYLIICILTTIALSYVTYRFIEKPFVILGKRISKYTVS